LLVTDVQGQAQQLVGTFHVFGLDDQRDAQVDGGKGVELDFRRQRILGQFAVAGVAAAPVSVWLAVRSSFDASVMACTLTGSIGSSAA
jgi:hypothetical protein